MVTPFLPPTQSPLPGSNGPRPAPHLNDWHMHRAAPLVLHGSLLPLCDQQTIHAAGHLLQLRLTPRDSFYI